MRDPGIPGVSHFEKWARLLAKLYFKNSGTTEKIVATLKEWEDSGVVNFADAAGCLELFA